MKISRSRERAYLGGLMEPGSGLLQRSFLAWSDFSERYTFSMRHTGAIGLRLSALALLFNVSYALS